MKKLYFKIAFDVVMTVAFILAMSYSLTGGYVHEILGLALLAAFILHKIFNAKWICAVSKKIVNGEKVGINGIKYIVDVLLLICFIVTGISGILISDYIFSDITISNRSLWVYIHTVSSWSALIIMSIHIGLHWNMIIEAFKKMFKIQKPKRILGIISRLIALITMLLGLKASFDKSFTEKFVPVSEKGVKANNSESLNETASSNDSSSDNSNGTNLNSANTAGISASNLSFHGGNSAGNYDFSSNPPQDGESQDEYLSRLNCTGCGRHCPLISPQCGTGSQYAQQATEYYVSYSNQSYDESVVSQNDTQNSDSQINNNDNNNTQTPSLQEYLGNLYCSGCGKHCSLLAPQCNKGEQQAQNAENEYYSMYSSNSEDDNETANDQQIQTTTNAETTVTSTETTTTIQNSLTDSSSAPTLEEYLGNLFCTGCNKHCSLLAPQCGRGEKQADAAETAYKAKYKTTSDTSSSEIVIEDDEDGSLQNIFNTMIPVMGLYIGITYYAIKFAKKVKK